MLTYDTPAYLGTDGRTDRDKTVYPSGGVGYNQNIGVQLSLFQNKVRRY
jgi:hypothetical protein